MSLTKLIEWLFWIMVGWFAFLGSAGCSSSMAGLSDKDIDRIGKLSDIAQTWGPEGSLRIRAGRPFLAALVEGVLIIPGLEIDMDASADPARAPASDKEAKSSTEPAADPPAEEDPNVTPTRWEPPAKPTEPARPGRVASADHIATARKKVWPFDPNEIRPVETVKAGKVTEVAWFRGDIPIASPE